jgi:acetyltransferase
VTLQKETEVYDTFLLTQPYPQQLVSPFRLKDNTEVIIRPIQPDDEALLVRFHDHLSERSVYFRYFHMIGLSQRTDHERLRDICRIDYKYEMVLVATLTDPRTGLPAILGVGRLNRLPGEQEAEFAVVVGDCWQGQGLGIQLVRRLIAYARSEKLARVVGEIHPDNRLMQQICLKLGFKRHYSIEDRLLFVSLAL